MNEQPASTAPAAAGHPRVQGRCPACGGSSLFLGSGGYLTCSRLDCPQPDAATEVLSDFWDARQHGAFTFCEKNVGHVTMAEFAKKISEKRTALAQREEASEYANSQKQLAEKAAAALDRVRNLAEVWQDAPDPLVRASAADLLTTIRGPQPAAQNDGPSVTEAAEADATHWTQKYAGE